MNEPAWDGKTERIAGDRPADAGGYFEEEVWEEEIAGQVTVTSKVTVTFLHESGDGLARLFAL